MPPGPGVEAQVPPGRGVEAQVPPGHGRGHAGRRERQASESALAHSLCGARQECLSRGTDKGKLGLKSVRELNIEAEMCLQSRSKSGLEWVTEPSL